MNRNFRHHIHCLDLDYDTEDVVDRLKELKVEEYSETKIDTDDVNPPMLFVFGKDVNGRADLCKVEGSRTAETSGVCVISLCKGENACIPYA